MSLLIAHDFTVEVHRDGKERLSYTVRGSVTCPTTGWTVTLSPDNEGIIDQPELAVLRLDAEPPSGTVIDVITEVPVEYTGTDDPRLEKIQIRLYGDIETPDGDDSIILKIPK
jgi:hypothetical protein